MGANHYITGIDISCTMLVPASWQFFLLVLGLFYRMVACVVLAHWGKKKKLRDRGICG